MLALVRRALLLCGLQRVLVRGLSSSTLERSGHYKDDPREARSMPSGRGLPLRRLRVPSSCPSRLKFNLHVLPLLNEQWSPPPRLHAKRFYTGTSGSGFHRPSTTWSSLGSSTALCSSGLRGLGYHALVDGRLEVHVASERHGVPEGKYLRCPIAAKAVLAVDPIEQIGQSSPAERACRAAGRRFLVVDHERVAPRLRHAGEELRVVRQ